MRFGERLYSQDSCAQNVTSSPPSASQAARRGTAIGRRLFLASPLPRQPHLCTAHSATTNDNRHAPLWRPRRDVGGTVDRGWDAGGETTHRPGWGVGGCCGCPGKWGGMGFGGAGAVRCWDGGCGSGDFGGIGFDGKDGLKLWYEDEVGQRRKKGGDGKGAGCWDGERRCQVCEDRSKLGYVFVVTTMPREGRLFCFSSRRREASLGTSGDLVAANIFPSIDSCKFLPNQ